MNRSCRTILLAKAPLPGQVKTRLIPALGPDGAAALATALLEGMALRAVEAGLGPVELCATPGPGHHRWRQLQLPATLEWSDQGEGDLGARLARATQRGLARDGAVLLIGMDCPALGASGLRAAAALLQTHDAALVPSHDGGYVLLGLRRFEPELFAAMPWSTAQVLAETRRRLRSAGFRWGELPPLADIDTPADLAGLPAPLQSLAQAHRRAPGA